MGARLRNWIRRRGQLWRLRRGTGSQQGRARRMLCDVSARTVEGGAPVIRIAHEARARLARARRCGRNLVADLDDPESRRAWLRSDNPYLGRLTPLEVLRAGRTDRVEAALEALDSGMFV